VETGGRLGGRRLVSRVLCLLVPSKTAIAHEVLYGGRVVGGKF
jgi:hypothetical protein